MACTNPKTVGFLSDGKTITWSPKKFSKEYATFQLPCSKCISCRLEYARQWAIRCVHEASMHPDNSFVTLTYDDNHLLSEKLQYKDFQNFMKRLRSKNPHLQIGVFVTGEYGEKTKRPHWHAILFNYRPQDAEYKYSNHRGDKVYSSKELEELWGHGTTEFGSVTIQSAGYCARYAAKKLVHGHDDDHDFQPISRKSSKHAIGKKWLEQFWKDCFNTGYITLPDGTKSGIPRYYEKWLQKYLPHEWRKYREKTKQSILQKIELADQLRKERELEINIERAAQCKPRQKTTNEAKNEIIQKRLNQLHESTKL